MNSELAMGVEWGVFHRLEWTRVNSCSARRWGPMRTSGFSRTWRKRSQSSLQWCGRTCSGHAVSILWVSCWRLPEFPELSLRRFIFNEWRKQEQMFIMKNSCSFSVCTALPGVRQGWEEAHHWRWFGGWVQSTVQSTTEWIWMDSHTKPWYAWYATRLITFTLCKRANSKFPCVRKGQLRKVCLLCCFPWLSAFPFQPRILPRPHTGLLNQMFAEQVELSRILGYTMIHLPVPSCANVMVRRCSKILEFPCGNRIGYRGRRSWRAQQTLSCRAHCLGADVTTENPCDIMQLYHPHWTTLMTFLYVFVLYFIMFTYVHCASLVRLWVLWGCRSLQKRRGLSSLLMSWFWRLWDY